METITPQEWDVIGQVLADQNKSDAGWLDDVVIPDGPCPRGTNPAVAAAETNAIWGTRFDVVVRAGRAVVQVAEDGLAGPHRRHDPHQAIQYLLDLGLKFREVSVALDRPIADVLEPYTISNADIPSAIRIVDALDRAAAAGRVLYSEIADQVGVGEQRVRRLAQSQGTPSNASRHRYFSSKHRDSRPRAERMLKAGIRVTDVSRKIEVPESTVREWATKAGITMHPQGRPKADLDWDLVREARSEGRTWGSIAATLGVASSTLRNRARTEL